MGVRPSPVFSVHQTDVIYYGGNLLDYVAHEFKVPPLTRHRIAALTFPSGQTSPRALRVGTSRRPDSLHIDTAEHGLRHERAWPDGDDATQPATKLARHAPP